MKTNKIKFTKQNPENRYEAVFYQPSLKQLKNDILIMGEKKNGCYSVLQSTLELSGHSRVEELISDQKNFEKLIYDLHKGRFPKFLLGLKSLENGEIINRHYESIYSYHPDEGYVILQKHSDRDDMDWGNTLKLVSLKTGNEIGEEFVDYVSGIINLNFQGLLASSNDQIPKIYSIDEEKQDLVENKDYSYEIKKSFNLPKANWAHFQDFGIEFIHNDNNYYEDPCFHFRYLEPSVIGDKNSKINTSWD